ncbi:putative Gp5 baseplate hub subunit and tail lysozyme [Vibrio phage RYC]|nr:putative Gp5 baseplate hub subunit and tail lysozyme [Vibrio phage RYC]
MILRKGSRGEDVRNIQEYLTTLGYDTNGVDGIFGNGTKNALIHYGEEVLSSSERDGELLTEIDGFSAFCILMDYYDKVTGIEDVAVEIPWIESSGEMYLEQEIKGDSHNPEILKIWKDAKLAGIKDDETPWCAGAVSAWLERAGIKSMRSAWARDYLKFGDKLLEPRFGCIVVFERGSGGHVGFVTGISEDGKQIRCLGGNQGDTVNERMFDVSRVLGYRQPEGFDLPEVPVVGKGKVSTNEA